MFHRITEPRRWTYVVAALPILWAAIYATEAGGALPYLLAAVFCALQFVFPTLLGWYFTLTLYALATLYYSFILLADMYRVLVGSKPRILLDVSDSLVFGGWVASLIVVTTMLWFMRSARRPPASREV